MAYLISETRRKRNACSQWGFLFELLSILFLWCFYDNQTGSISALSLSFSSALGIRFFIRNYKITFVAQTPQLWNGEMVFVTLRNNVNCIFSIIIWSLLFCSSKQGLFFKTIFCFYHCFIICTTLWSLSTFWSGRFCLLFSCWSMKTFLSQWCILDITTHWNLITNLWRYLTTWGMHI